MAAWVAVAVHLHVVEVVLEVVTLMVEQPLEVLLQNHPGVGQLVTQKEELS